jgi:hypothetical protein
MKLLSTLADDYWVAKKARLAADKTAEMLKTKESALKAEIMEIMRLQNLSALGGELVRLTLDTKPTDEPMVKDWSKVYAYILETKDFSLLEKRIGKAATKERWEQGVDVPGVEKFQVYKLHESEVKT